MKDIQEQQLTARSQGMYAKFGMSDTQVKDRDVATGYRTQNELVAPNEMQLPVKYDGKFAEHQLAAEKIKQQVEDLKAIDENKEPSFVLKAREEWNAISEGIDDPEMLRQKEWCIKKGIGPDEYFKDIQQEKEEARLYAKYLMDPSLLDLQISEKEFDKLIQKWRATLSQADYEKQRELIFKAAAKGTTPTEYAKQHAKDWNKLFIGSSLEHLLEKGLLGKGLELLIGDQLQQTEEIIEETPTAEKAEAEAVELPVLLAEQIKSSEELKGKQEEWARNAFAYYYKLQGKQLETLEYAERQSVEEMIKMGIGPTGKPMQADIVSVSELSDPDRVKYAELLLKRQLTQPERDAILKAHHEAGMVREEDENGVKRIVYGPDGKPMYEDGKIAGKKAGLYNYTENQLLEKGHILAAGGIKSKEERRLLIETGIAAVSNDDDDADTGFTGSQDLSEGQKKKDDDEPRLYGTWSKKMVDEKLRQVDFNASRLNDVNSVEGLRKMLKDISHLSTVEGKIPRERAEQLQSQIAQREEDLRKEYFNQNRELIKQEQRLARERLIQEHAQRMMLDANNPEHRRIIEANTPELKQTGAEEIENLTKAVESYTDNQVNVERAQNNFLRLRRYVDALLDSVDRGTLTLKPETLRTLQEAKSFNPENASLQQIKDRTATLGEGGIDIKKFFFQTADEQAKPGGRLTIQSLDELADYIAMSGGEFGSGGKYQIINERGEVVTDNLISWIRERLSDIRGNISPDSAMNVFSDIQIPTGWRDVSLNQLAYVPNYFRRRKLIVHGTEDGRTRVQEENVQDAEYEAIKDEMINEAWLFGGMHSKDATYRGGKANEKGLGEMSKLYADEMFTKSRSRLLGILNLRRSGNLSKEVLAKEKEQGSVGLAIQKAILAYYHLMEMAPDPYAAEDIVDKDTDSLKKKEENKKKRAAAEKKYKQTFEGGRNEFREVMGKDGMNRFFQSISTQLLRGDDAYKSEIGQLLETIKSYKDPEDEEVKRLVKVVKAQLKDGKFDPEKDEMLQLLDLKEGRDLFWNAIKDSEKTKIYKLTEKDLEAYGKGGEELERVTRKIMKNVNEMEWGELNIFAQKKEQHRNIQLIRQAVTDAVSYPLDLSKNDRDYAGHWAFGMSYWTGIAARNDTAAQGFDAWSKLINFKYYRIRGAQERTGAGNLQSIPGINRLSFTFWDGVKVKYAKDVKFSDEDIAKMEFPPYLQNKSIEEKRTYLETKKEGFETKLIDVIKENINTGKGVPKFDFEGTASSDFSDIHLRQAYSLFAFMMDQQEFRLTDMFKVDSRTGKLILNHEKTQSFMGGAVKAAKYAFDQNDYLWDSTIRDYVKDPNTGDMVFRTMRLRDYMFGQEVQELGKHMFTRKHFKAHAKLMQDVINPLTGEKENLNVAWARPIAGYLVVKELQNYLDAFSNYGSYDAETIKEIEGMFRMISSDIKIVDKNGRPRVIVNEPFFTNYEWNQMLKLIGTSYGKMYAKKAAVDVPIALLGMGTALIGGFVKELNPLSSAT